MITLTTQQCWQLVETLALHCQGISVNNNLPITIEDGDNRRFPQMSTVELVSLVRRLLHTRLKNPTILPGYYFRVEALWWHTYRKDVIKDGAVNIIHVVK
jgi:hypothetical protein